jgi:hypothetical protein
MHLLALAVAALMLVSSPAFAQTARRAAPKPAPPKAPAKKVEPAAVACMAPLGTGVRSQRAYCDVLTGRDPAEGTIVTLPPHVGPATLTFDLHNRHTYSEEQAKAGRAFAEYTATIGLLTRNNDLISRAAINSSFRQPADLVDRIGAGTGATGLKAVAPLGTETISVEIPEGVTEVSVLGERLTVQRFDGRDVFTSPGRPVAIISNLTVEYTPVPPKPAPKKKAPVRKKPAPKKPR